MSRLRPTPKQKEKKPNFFQRVKNAFIRNKETITRVAVPAEISQAAQAGKSTLRSLGALAAGVTGKPITPSNRLSKTVLGSDPIKSIPAQMAESEQKHGRVLGPALIGLGVGIDLAPPVSGKTTAGKGVLKTVGRFLKGSRNVVKTAEPTARTVAKSSILRDVAKQAKPAITVIKQEGDAGTRLAQKITRAADVGEVNAGKRVAALQQAPKLTRTERLNMTDVLEGKAKPMNVNVEKAAQVARAQLDDVAKEAVDTNVQVRRKTTLHPGAETKGLTNLQRERLAAGKDVKATISETFKPREDYFPHIIPDSQSLAKGPVRVDVVENLVRRGIKPTLKEAEQFVDDYRNFIDTGVRQDSILKYMTETGQAANEAEALANLQRFRQRTIKKQGSLEMSRQVDLPFYDPDPGRVLPSYLTNTSKRLSEIRELGQKQENVNQLIKEIRDAGGDADITRKAVDRILNIVNDTSGAKKALVFARTLQGFKLGLASISNVSQGFLNSLLKGDLRAVAAGLKGLMTKEGRLLGLRSGASLESVVQEAGRSTGALSTFLKATGFSATERSNRIIAANAGRSYGTRLFKSMLKKPNKNTKLLLEELGVNVDEAVKRGSLTDDDILMMAKKFSDLTQFRSRPQDLPLFASTEIGKTVFQFKTFIYGQTRLLYRTTVQEIRNGNYGRATRNLLVLATVFPLAGEAVADVRSLITGRKREARGLARYLENIAQVGALGILMDAIRSGSNRYGTEFVAGPTAGDIGGLLDAAGSKRPGTELGRFALKRIPIIGSRLSAKVFPTQASKKKSTSRRGSKLRKGK